ncbi:MAG: hypothetical protein A3E83_00830 [Gammaproteobacteria bacterium RIFCSPHIGHO2_12_FULL_41_20]|nr:MAG: hypothetical protein A3E83_00830 [Gammaproteobacteria bacterium RIFCSPHIGHO2_12_FULL_41_20]
MEGGIVVPQSAKQFADRLNKGLDELDVPAVVRERVTILSKMLQIPKQQAWNLLEGYQLPDEQLLQQIANELEVETGWLVGK